MTDLGAVGDLWSLLELRGEALSALSLTGADPVLPSVYKVGEAAQASIAATGLAAAELHRLRTGAEQIVSVDMRHAAAEFRSERLLRVNGGEAPELWDAIAGTYRCGDGRWVRLHTNFDHHRDGVLRILGCDNDRKAVADALQDWSGADFEEEASSQGLVVALMRSREEWLAHPQADIPPILIERIGEAPAQGFGPGDRPLSGVRVLDLTRIIAGPTGGRALAAHGATVMRVASPYLPSIPVLVMETGRGKLSTHLDLESDAGRAGLERLLGDADVFIQGYRPGGIAARGFSPERAAEVRPGIVYVSLSAYGHKGPWADKRGFDSLVQTATGMNHMEAAAAGVEGPKPMPCQALDHASGYFIALGAMAGLMRRAQEGGSWHVRVALASTARWLDGLGRVPEGPICPEPSDGETASFLTEAQSGFGTLTHTSHAAILSETPARWAQPAVPLGTHPPIWP